MKKLAIDQDKSSLEEKHTSLAATMKQVATLAGVSTATVSRALAKSDKVSASTRQKVERAVLSAGYSTSHLLRDTKGDIPHTVLVFLPDNDDPLSLAIIKGIEEIAAEKGRLVLLSHSDQKLWQNPTQLTPFFARRYSGIILLSPHLLCHLHTEDRQQLPPIVVANQCFSAPSGLPSVHIDNLTAAFNAVNHLYQLGHRRIAAICGSQEVPANYYRKQGYMQALRRHGIALEKRYVVYGDFSYQSGVRGLNTLMALPQPPTAIFCHHDLVAIGALAQAKNIGLSVPNDLSLIGFDGIPQTEYSDPPLTTVVQPGYQIGQQAMLLLLKLLQGQALNCSSLLLESQIIIRRTTATPSTLVKSRLAR